VTAPLPAGWGAGGWGSSFWGAGAIVLALEEALAVRENVVQLTFSAPIYFSGVLDPGDGSDPSRYQLNPVAGTSGMDGQPARSVAVVSAAVTGLGGAQIQVTVDRPFSPYGARYTVTAVGVRDLIGNLIAPGLGTQEFFGLYRQLATPSLDVIVPSRDIANPQDRQALLDPLPMYDPLVLGTIPVDDTGDYAFDEGITNTKKRIFRRVLTTANGFAHLRDYGVGLATFGKRLGSAVVRQQLASEIERQVRLEPDVASCSAIVVPDTEKPGIFRVRMLVTTTTQQAGQTATTLNIPIGPF
jgi:hypothetical protein